MFWSLSMWKDHPKISCLLPLILAMFGNSISLAASQYDGQIMFSGVPIPGATVIATQDNKHLVTVTNQQGIYSFSNLEDGSWTIEIEMTGFKTAREVVSINPMTALTHWELQLLPLRQIKARIETLSKSMLESANTQQTDQAPASEEGLNGDVSEGLLINGSVNNGAASQFSQAAAFGNNRSHSKGVYTGGLGLILDNSILDAAPFSLTGQPTPKPSYNDLTALATLGGPLRIPHLLPNGPNFFLAYEWTRNRNSTTATGRMPNLEERNGVFSEAVLDPLTGAFFPGNAIPRDRISSQARALLNLYPSPNFETSARYNYQVPIISPTHRDALQSRLNKSVNSRNQISGSFSFQDVRESASNLFGFRDSTDALGMNTAVKWWHRLSEHWFINTGFQFSRFASHSKAYFEDRENISGQADISGNNQDSVNWGPPNLTFSSGIAGLSDGLPSFDRNRTSRVSSSMKWNYGSHDVTFGGDYGRQEFNYLSQEDPRGTFTFTGAVTGIDFSDFLLGIPDASSIAFGNADKYFRSSLYDAYAADDWKINPQFTINAGIRWEYGTPITELYGRLVNLDISSDFGAVSPVVANYPIGSLTGQRYPTSLLNPDKNGFEPRIGVAWRPLSGSSVVVRAGYGIYYDSSVYQNIALQMSQQSPLSKTLNVQNSPAASLTLANGFQTSPFITPNTFAVDPNFRIGYAQQWQLGVQRDLPGSLQITANYLGTKGTRGMQESLPNTYPIGAPKPCLSCPAGFVYLTSNGNSIREAAQLQLRRRLHNGITGTLEYTFSKSIDNDAILGGQGAAASLQNGGAQNATANGQTGNAGSLSTAVGPAALNVTSAAPQIAQNWLNLAAERSLSNFDQRHLVNLDLQYTTGMGLGGGTLMSGWKGAMLKEWTIATTFSAGTGLPQTPIYLAVVPGTGVVGTIRPDYTGVPIYATPPGLFLNPAAYQEPSIGKWGNAGRNSITGPAQLVLNASMGRTFRVNDRLRLDLRFDARNVLNHVNFISWNTTINNAQFGLPTTTQAMRSMQLILRLRF